MKKVKKKQLGRVQSRKTYQQKNNESGLKDKWKYILYAIYNLYFSINICSLWIQENLCYNKENWRTLFILFQVWRGHILFVFGGGMWKKSERRQDGKEKLFRKLPLLGSCPYGTFFILQFFIYSFYYKVKWFESIQ